MSSNDHWRITTRAIELEMERIAGLLQKSVHFHSRNKIGLHRQETEPAPQPAPEHAPDLAHQR